MKLKFIEIENKINAIKATNMFFTNTYSTNRAQKRICYVNVLEDSIKQNIYIDVC